MECLKHIQFYKPEYFRLEEIFPAEVIEAYGEDCWQFMDHRILQTIDVIRKRLNRKTYINGYNPIRKRVYQYRGFRPNTYIADYLNCSQHRFGRALDFDVEGMTAAEVRAWLLENQDLLPHPIWVEETNKGEPIDWNHIDVRYSDKVEKVYFFAA